MKRLQMRDMLKLLIKLVLLNLNCEAKGEEVDMIVCSLKKCLQLQPDENTKGSNEVKGNRKKELIHSKVIQLNCIAKIAQSPARLYRQIPETKDASPMKVMIQFK